MKHDEKSFITDILLPIYAVITSMLVFIISILLLLVEVWDLKQFEYLLQYLLFAPAVLLLCLLAILLFIYLVKLFVNIKRAPSLVLLFLGILFYVVAQVSLAFDFKLLNVPAAFLGKVLYTGSIVFLSLFFLSKVFSLIKNKKN